MKLRYYYLLLVLTPLVAFTLSITKMAIAQDDNDDIRLRLQQKNKLDARQQEIKILKDELAKDNQVPKLIIDGKSYDVGNNVNDLGRALYMSLQNRQWQMAAYFLQRYLLLPNHDLMLAHYARGSLARLQGQLSTAEFEFRALLTIKPNFLLGQLALARVLFESKQDSDAADLFKALRQDIAIDNEHTAGVKKSIDSYIKALENRTAWRGGFSLGPSYSDNLNQSSESYTCFLQVPDGGPCLAERRLPDAVSASGIDFDFSLQKRFAMSGHHGIEVSALLYGNLYQDYSEYNDNTALVKVGYSYQDEKNQYFASPLFEYQSQGNKALSVAWGGHLSWFRSVSAETGLKLELNHKNRRYRNTRYRYEDGALTSAYFTVWQQLPQGWLSFGGIDYSKKNNNDKTRAYQTYGIRLGLSKTLFDGINATLFTSFRDKRYGAYNAVIREKRQDNEQSYTFILDMPRFTFYDLKPSLKIRHMVTRSNVDWLYSHDKNTVSFKFEKRF